MDKLERLCTTRGLAKQVAGLPPAPENATAAAGRAQRYTYLVLLLVAQYEAKMEAEFGDVTAGNKYIGREAMSPTTCPNTKCGAPILLCCEVSDKDFRKQFFSPEHQCKGCGQKYYPELPLDSLCRQRGLRVADALDGRDGGGGGGGGGDSIAEWAGTPLVRLDRQLAKRYVGKEIPELRKDAFMRGLDLTGKSEAASTIDILVEEDLMQLTERVWSLQVVTVAQECTPYIWRRGEGEDKGEDKGKGEGEAHSFPRLDQAIELDHAALCALLETEPSLATDGTLESKYGRKKYRLADDSEVKWHGTKGESKNRLNMLSPPSLSVLCGMYGIPLPPKAVGSERSQSLAVAAIVHFEATLAGARTEAVQELGAQYDALESNELKIKCKKRRVQFDESGGKPGYIAALVHADNLLWWTQKVDWFRRSQESARELQECKEKGDRIAEAMATSGLKGEAALVWKMWQVEKDHGFSTASDAGGAGAGAGGGSGSGGSSTAATDAVATVGTSGLPAPAASTASSTAASSSTGTASGEPYVDPCELPLGIASAPAWLHGQDTKQKPAAALVQALSLGAFLVRLKKKGKGVVYSLAINVGTVSQHKRAAPPVHLLLRHLVPSARCCCRVAP